MSSPPTAQKLLALLPAIYREDPFLGQYLWAFEKVLLALENRVDTLDALFDPMRTDPEFLPWLSSWMAFTIRADLDITKQRDFLRKVIPLYRKRGTLGSLQELLAIFATGTPIVSEEITAADGPHFFRVTISLPRDDEHPAEPLRQGAIVQALIELEKPAHTRYRLEVNHPTMQVEKHSTVGVDTLLGTGTDG